MRQVKVLLTALVALTALVLVGCGGDAKERPVSEKQEKEISERLAPAGSVLLEGEAGAGAVATVSAEPRSGEEIYNSKCLACHATGAAGAPKVGVADQWAPRVAQGMDVVYANAWNGIRGMPAKGLCMDCSEDELNASVDYMVDNSK